MKQKRVNNVDIKSATDEIDYKNPTNPVVKPQFGMPIELKDSKSTNSEDPQRNRQDTTP